MQSSHKRRAGSLVPRSCRCARNNAHSPPLYSAEPLRSVRCARNNAHSSPLYSAEPLRSVARASSGTIAMAIANVPARTPRAGRPLRLTRVVWQGGSARNLFHSPLPCGLRDEGEPWSGRASYPSAGPARASALRKAAPRRGVTDQRAPVLSRVAFRAARPQRGRSPFSSRIRLPAAPNRQGTLFFVVQ